MRVLALDIGDRWIGVAISDPLRILARPYTTVEKKDLDKFLEDTCTKENVSLVVVGYPQTLRGLESQQTKSVVAVKEELEKKFSHLTWVLCDERFSSKNAAQLHKAPKEKEHARAAAFILTIYLNSLQYRENK